MEELVRLDLDADRSDRFFGEDKARSDRFRGDLFRLPLDLFSLSEAFDFFFSFLAGMNSSLGSDGFDGPSALLLDDSNVEERGDVGVGGVTVGAAGEALAGVLDGFTAFVDDFNDIFANSA